ncbi:MULTISPECIES: sensor histidine kinase [unclassified Streptomyces]|uniref:sensor histidine kinase n=1 Tax=unclassified Streptomyces TaxID=2593676 RepID=UPI0019030B8C|nr:sensor histidine kinase [Streptomyces sp. HSG2]
MSRSDLWWWRADPLPPSVWLRWVPHGLVCMAAIGVLAGDSAQLRENGGLPAESAFLIGLGQAGAMVLALWFPVPAWWISTAATVLTASAVRAAMEPHPDGQAFTWPWTAAGIIAHLVVLLLLALRVPTRVAGEAVAFSTLITYALQGLWGGPSHQSTGVVAVALFGVVTLLGTALRGRREARAKLKEQTSLTAEERARRTLLEERGRIARELHDVVAHHMSVISIQAQVAPHLVPHPTDELKENLAGIRGNALEALTELRRVLGVLRSDRPESGEPLDESGTAGAALVPHSPQPSLERLDSLVDNTRSAGLTVTTEISGARRSLPPGVELSAYRIVQEALSNVLRHAPGARTRVRLTHLPTGLRLEVVNSPPERTPAPSRGAGHGLLGMRERVAMLGGTLAAHSLPDGGYRVTAFLPADGTGPPPPDDTNIRYCPEKESG